MMKLLIKVFDSVGALKWMKSSKATIGIAGGGLIVAFINEAIAAGYPPLVIACGSISIAIIAAAIIFGQAGVDKSKETTKSEIEKMRLMAKSETTKMAMTRSDKPEEFNRLMDITKDAFVICFLFLIVGSSIACDKPMDRDVTEKVFGNAVICVQDAETEIPQIYGMVQGPKVVNDIFYEDDFYLRVVGQVCKEITVEEPKNPTDTPETQILCTQGNLLIESLATTECVKIIGGAQDSVNVFIDSPLCHDELSLIDITLGPQRTFSLSRNDRICLQDDNGFWFPDCEALLNFQPGPYVEQSLEQWQSCCWNPIIGPINHEADNDACMSN